MAGERIKVKISVESTLDCNLLQQKIAKVSQSVGDYHRLLHIENLGGVGNGETEGETLVGNVGIHIACMPITDAGTSKQCFIST